MAAWRKDAGRRYQDFDPSSEWIREEGSNALALHLPDFKKEELKVQRDDSGNLKITGERSLGDNKWSRFTKNVNVSPADYDINNLLASFEGGVLKIRMPKIITPTRAPPKPTPQKPPSQKPVTEPQFQPPPSREPVMPPPIPQTPPSRKPIIPPPTPKIPPSQKPVTEPEFQPPPSQKPVTQPETGVQPKPTTRADKKMNGEGSDQEQVDGYAGAKKVTNGEESEIYDTAEEGAHDRASRVKDFTIGGVAAADDGAARVKDYSVGGVADAGVGLHRPQQLLVNVVVGILVVLALLMYIKYTQGSTRKATD